MVLLGFINISVTSLFVAVQLFCCLHTFSHFSTVVKIYKYIWRIWFLEMCLLTCVSSHRTFQPEFQRKPVCFSYEFEVLTLVMRDIQSCTRVQLTSSVDLKMAALSDAPLTACQQEAAGLKTVSVPGFRPSCDSRGQYMPQQCFKTLCWCVNPVNGEQIQGSEGSNHCSTRVFSGEEDIFNVKIIQLFAFLARKE